MKATSSKTARFLTCSRHRRGVTPSAPATLAPVLQKEFVAHAGDGRVGNELSGIPESARF